MISKSFRTITVSLLIVKISINVDAQQLPDPVDLRAAYCISTYQNAVEVLSAGVDNNNVEEWVKEFNEAVKEEILYYELRLSRLRLYLVPRLRYIDKHSINGGP